MSFVRPSRGTMATAIHVPPGSNAMLKLVAPFAVYVQRGVRPSRSR